MVPYDAIVLNLICFKNSNSIEFENPFFYYALGFSLLEYELFKEMEMHVCKPNAI